jgi:multicomponent K+:H+ antiporter subunit E
MNRLLPYPLMWLALFAMWLILNVSIAPGHLLLGAVIATLACLAVHRLEPPKSHIRRVGVVLELIAYVLHDILRSNIAVIGLTLSGRQPRSRFPNGLAILSVIVTATPGSAWVHYDSMGSRVIIHVLDTDDEAAWNATLKRTYEKRLMEIFG